MLRLFPGSFTPDLLDPGEISTSGCSLNSSVLMEALPLMDDGREADRIQNVAPDGWTCFKNLAALSCS